MDIDGCKFQVFVSYQTLVLCWEYLWNTLLSMPWLDLHLFLTFSFFVSLDLRVLSFDNGEMQFHPYLIHIKLHFIHMFMFS